MPQHPPATAIQDNFSFDFDENLQAVQSMPASPKTMVYGTHKKLIKAAIWFNIIYIAVKIFKNPVTALKRVKELSLLRDNYRNKNKIIKYAKAGGRYFFSYNAPGWPSLAFNQYIASNFKILSPGFGAEGLLTLIFAITKKCGYKCEHCFEWEVLNKKEILTRENMLKIVDSFQQLGISQLILSGGEPLNRIDDIIFILENIKPGTEVWLFTSGYHLTTEKARRLKAAGLTGVSVSLDHWQASEHDNFRGRPEAFSWAAKAVSNSHKEKLVVCLSLCTTRQFTTEYNLKQYAELAKNWGVSFIQLIEPKAVGHYAGKDVSLSEKHIQTIEEFYTALNFSNSYRNYPAVIYHEFYSRRIGCAGGGNRYLYVDTDGDVHNCPFCQKKLFSAFSESLKENLARMRTAGCSTFRIVQ